MSTDLVSLSPNDTVTSALMKMRDSQIHNIPVIDEDEKFIGLFSLRRLNHALLPKAAQLDQKSLLMDLSFMPDNHEAMIDRLREIGSQPVCELLEKKRKLRFCTVDTPLPEVLMLLSENPVSLPVIVLDKDERLQGMISNWDVLTKIAINILAAPSAASADAETTTTNPPSDQSLNS